MKEEDESMSVIATYLAVCGGAAAGDRSLLRIAYTSVKASEARTARERQTKPVMTA